MEDTILNSVLKNLSKNDIEEWEYWALADKYTLSEGIFLIFGKVPTDSLEKAREAIEYPQEFKCYGLAERSIQAEILPAKQTKTGYMVNPDDLLEWALKKEMGTVDALSKLRALRKSLQKNSSPDVAKEGMTLVPTKASHLEAIKQKAIHLIQKYRRQHPNCSNRIMIERLHLKVRFKKQNKKEFSFKF